MTGFKLLVNGATVEADVQPETLLIEFLRHHLHLTGAHVGCETTQCSAWVCRTRTPSASS